MCSVPSFVSPTAVPTGATCHSTTCVSPARRPVPSAAPPPSPPPPPARLRAAPRAQCPSKPPDFEAGFDPAASPDYNEVRAFTIATTRHGGALLTLRPVHGGRDAFKMTVTTVQADAIRSALTSRRHTAADLSSQDRRDATPPPPPPPLPAAARVSDRPDTHTLFKTVLDAVGGIVSHAAITHIDDSIFVARVWVRSADGVLINLDARPSDAIVLTIRSSAPLFLNSALLSTWRAPIAALESDASRGMCVKLQYDEACKSARSIREEARQRPELFRLAFLKTRLDLAVRLERFAEAESLRRAIDHVCPIDLLSQQRDAAVREERFLDAARLQDEITVWKARLHMWQKGGFDPIDDLKDNLNRQDV